MQRSVPPPAGAAGWAMRKATPPERLIAVGRGDPEPTPCPTAINARRPKAALHTVRLPGACGGRRVSHQVSLRHKAAWWLDAIATSGA